MIQVYTQSDDGINTNINTPIIFNNIAYKCCSCNRSSTPNSIVSIEDAGVYKVHFDGILSNNTTASAEIGVSLYNNNNPIVYAKSSETSENSDDIVSLSFDTIIRVRRSCPMIDNDANLQFIITGANSLVYLANVIVENIK